MSPLPDGPAVAFVAATPLPRRRRPAAPAASRRRGGRPAAAGGGRPLAAPRLWVAAAAPPPAAGGGGGDPPLEAVEDGVRVPPAAAPTLLPHLADALTAWLDTEWLPLPAHATIGALAAELVGRTLSAAAAGAGGGVVGGDDPPLPATGDDAAAAAAAAGDAAAVDSLPPTGGGGGVDLTDLVLAVAGGLEGSPLLADIYVGPFDVGNRVAEEVLAWMGREGCCAGAEAEEVAAFREKHHVWDGEGGGGASGGGAGASAAASAAASSAYGGDGATSDSSTGLTTDATAAAAAAAATPAGAGDPPPCAAAVPEARRPPSLATRFERWAFLGRLLDGEVPDETANAVVLTVLGFEYDPVDDRWTGERVAARATWLDGRPAVPDFLGDPADAAALAAQLPTEPEKVTALAEFVELVHGEEATMVERAEGGAAGEAWRRREVVVQWLHMFGGF